MLSRGRSSARTSAVSCSLPVNSDSSPSRRSACQVPSRPVQQVAPGDRGRLAEASLSVAHCSPLSVGRTRAEPSAKRWLARRGHQCEPGRGPSSASRVRPDLRNRSRQAAGRVRTVSSGSPATSMPAPRSGSRSRTTTSWPTLARRAAAASPASPPPTTAINVRPASARKAVTPRRIWASSTTARAIVPISRMAGEDRSLHRVGDGERDDGDEGRVAGERGADVAQRLGGGVHGEPDAGLGDVADQGRDPAEGAHRHRQQVAARPGEQRADQRAGDRTDEGGDRRPRPSRGRGSCLRRTRRGRGCP